MDKNSFIEFYNQHIEKIYRFIYFRVDSEETAQDLSSEAFLKFWDAINNKSDKIENHRAFLYQLVRNLITDFYRYKPKHETILISNAQGFSDIPDEENLIEKISIKSEFNEARQAIKQIQPEQQEAIILRYLDELEIGEIAHILGKSEGAVRVLIHRGLGALRKVMQA